MSNSDIRERSLRQLLADNFIAARQCRKCAEDLADVSLKYYFKNIASRRSQFAIELAEEISYYGGKEPHMPTATYERTRKEPEQDENVSVIKKMARLHKESLQAYQNALCKIHDGSCREILLRHRAFLENTMFELKSLKTLLKYNSKRSETSKEISNHS